MDNPLIGQAIGWLMSASASEMIALVASVVVVGATLIFAL